MLIDSPLVSVIIPTYGRPEKLARAIESLLVQTYKNIEIIIVDDNPPDSANRLETEKKIAEFLHIESVRYLKRAVNGGGSLARNTGIDAAKGMFVTFLDDDDIYLPQKVERQVNHIISKNIDVSVCDMQFSENDKIIETQVSYAEVGDLANFLTRGNTFTPMILCKKECLRLVNGFHDTPKFQDHLLMIKLLRYDFKVEILREKLFIHNNHQEERITLTSRFCDGYKEKIKFEIENKDYLSRHQNKIVSFRREMVMSRIITHEKGVLFGMKHWVSALFYITTARQVKIILKTLLRNIVKPHRRF
ncbi:glycosyltransferase family 2 protein [Sodalis ligni]|uniref:Glycosyltransferase involved in cell wall biosynthesis n=1 Tax=Sodalis ligni TaxID=2697027 RepID=A0A4R1NRB6_9GAMM|nr:glycosyltransferase family 2 protein [Sodalis ligni]TCL07336.1 glycosyltransferase involved in cell wall biosynthesis [Sodalis ligni]